MRIGIVIGHCKQQWSSKVTAEIAKNFVKRGHETHIFSNIWDEIEGVEFHKIPMLTSNFSIRELSFSAISTVVMKNHNFDVTMSQATRYLSPDVTKTEFCYAAARDYKKIFGEKPITLEKLSSIIEGYNFRKAKKCIAISTGIKNDIMKYYNIPEEKIVVIPNGVDSNKFKLDKKTRFRLRKEMKMSDDDIILIFVGRNLLRKGLKFVLKTLPLVSKRVKLIVAGGDDEYHRQLCKKLKIQNRVLFVGDVKNIVDYYSLSDIFILPTLYEPFGLVILEAMASGLPILTSRNAGAAELIEDKKEGLLINNPRNPAEIASKLNRLIDNKRLRNELGRNAKKKARSYSWKKVAEQILDVFGEV